MNNLNGNRKNEFRRKQEEKQRKLALKIEDEAGELREGSLKSEEAIPSLDELCTMGERVEQQTTFSAKEAIRNKIKARRDAERYKTTSTDSEKWTPNPFEDSNAAAIESPKNEDTLNTTRKHADAQSTKSAGLKTSKRRSIVEMVQKLKKYVPIVVCGDVLYYYNGYYYEAIGLEKLIKLYRKYVDYDLNNEPSLYAYKDLYQCCTTDPELERSEPENQSIHAPLENGVYDLMKKELKPHDPRRLIFTYIKASYDESAECPVFNSFLKQITHGNPQLEERFWMAIGYLMIYPARGKFFIVMGYARDSGKSVLGNFIQRLYPKESVGNLRLQEMKGTFSSKAAQEKAESEAAVATENEIASMKAMILKDCNLSDIPRDDKNQMANADEKNFYAAWKEAAAEKIAEKNQGNNAEDLVRITFEQMVDFYKKIYPDSTLINTEKGILESIDSASSEMEEAKTSDLGYSVEDAELYEGKFYIYKRMETHYDDTLLGSLQKELDSFNTSKAIEWLAYDVDYLMGEAYPGETAYVLITEDEYTFSKQGAYKLTYVDTGKTTELVDDQGFRWEASVYFVVDEDTYNENLQKMFRAEQALYDTYERILNNFGLAE